MNIKDAERPAHQYSLISTFAIPYLESIIVKLSTCKITLLYLVSKQVGS